MTDVTQILSQIESGDPGAAEQLLPLVYDELRKLAAAKLAFEKPGHTLQATALVHEAFLATGCIASSSRTIRQLRTGMGGGISLRLRLKSMRRILVENARRKGPGINMVAD